MTTAAENKRDCKHGQLARSCNVCELESEVARQAAEIERLKSTPPDQREDLRCVIADLTRQCQESDALLRQASELLHRRNLILGNADDDVALLKKCITYLESK